MIKGETNSSKWRSMDDYFHMICSREMTEQSKTFSSQANIKIMRDQKAFNNQ